MEKPSDGGFTWRGREIPKDALTQELAWQIIDYLYASLEAEKKFHGTTLALLGGKVK